MTSFQNRVQPWMLACFGPAISADCLERSDRFIEEALELVQAGGYSKERAHQLVDYVFDRPQGEIAQEVGGVMVTLAAYCLAHGIDMHACGETELARIWTKVETIRAKQAAKPTGSALPVPSGRKYLSTCPTCASPSPHMHPALQAGGEVEICADQFHLTPTPQNRPEYIERVRAKRSEWRDK